MNAQRRQRADAAIDRRTRARQIAAWQRQQCADRMPPARRAAQLAWLQQLGARVTRNEFSDAERLEARAALLDGSPMARQASLALGVARHG